jgi:hypothetical protein
MEAKISAEPEASAGPKGTWPGNCWPSSLAAASSLHLGSGHGLCEKKKIKCHYIRIQQII